MKNLYPSLADHTSGTILNEKRAFDLCRRLIADGHEASVSTDTVLGTSNTRSVGTINRKKIETLTAERRAQTR